MVTRGKVMTPTMAEATAVLREVECTLRKVEGEYRVNFLGGREATAYYTDDLTDAIFTGRAMVAYQTVSDVIRSTSGA